jgi:hypothetical protein
MSEQSHPISDLALERYLLGELPPPELERLRQAATQDADLRARLERLERSNRELEERYPTPWMSRQIRRRWESERAPARPVRRAALGYWAVPAAAVALLVAAVSVLRGPGPSEVTRVKGAPHLALFRKTATGSEQLTDGSRARQGDLVQIACDAGGMRYGAILSLDGRGAVSLHLPAAGDRAATLPAGGRDTLDFAYLLDDAPRFERFYLVTADTPFALAGLRSQLAGMNEAGSDGRLSLPDGYQQEVFTLYKEQDHD